MVPVPPVWVKEAALTAGAVRVPTEVTVISPRVFPPPPTAPVKVIFPVPALKDISPATEEVRVLEKVILEFCVLRVTVPVLLLRVVALAKVMVAPEAVPVILPEVVIPPAPVKDTAPPEVISPEVMIPPTPVKVTAPFEIISPAELIVSAAVSALRITTGVAAASVAVTAPFKTMLSATKFSPVAAL